MQFVLNRSRMPHPPHAPPEQSVLLELVKVIWVAQECGVISEPNGEQIKHLATEVIIRLILRCPIPVNMENEVLDRSPILNTINPSPVRIVAQKRSMFMRNDVW